MALTTEQVALWKRNAEIVNSYATDIKVKILQDRIIALADEVLANREAQPVAWHFPGSETESAQLGYDHELDDEQKQNCIPLYTAPPAPGVVKLPATRLWAGVIECYEKSDVIAALRAANVGVSDD